MNGPPRSFVDRAAPRRSRLVGFALSVVPLCLLFCLVSVSMASEPDGISGPHTGGPGDASVIRSGRSLRLASLNALADADAAWAARAERLIDDRAAPERIREALEAYRAAIETGPRPLEARWKLMRALHYTVDFTAVTEEDADRTIREGIRAAELSLNEIAANDVGSPEERARIYFWSSILWGTRAARVGLLTLVREGAATRMHDYAERALALDPSVDQGGSLRLLSRLHGTLPRVPFVSSWVTREKALPYAEQAFALYPAHPGSRLVLALTILEQAPHRSAEARGLLQSVIDAEPRPGFVVEDLTIRREAFDRLAALEIEGDSP
jgi:tetratricopeptide (TPR) repeat protein